MNKRQEFESIVDTYIKREGIGELMEWIKQTDFYTAPASTRFHGSYEGGLVEHSVNVFKEIQKLAEVYGAALYWTPESIAIVSLFHDVCKIGCYKTELRWRKDEFNRWEQYPTYKFKEDYPFGGHGAKSVYLVQNFMKLTSDEAAAINSHMGSWDATTYSNPTSVYEENTLAWILHVADEAADFIVERRENAL